MSGKHKEDVAPILNYFSRIVEEYLVRIEENIAITKSVASVMNTEIKDQRRALVKQSVFLPICEHN